MCPENAELKSTQLLSLFHIICAGHSDSQPEKLQFLIDNLPKESSITLISSQSANGFTPLHIAIYRGDVAILKALIATKLVDLDQSGRHLLPALHLAAMIGDSEMLTILLNSGANIHVTDFVHFTALHCATYFGQENVSCHFPNRSQSFKIIRKFLFFRNSEKVPNFLKSFRASQCYQNFWKLPLPPSTF